jgi:hypothetical protein
VAQMCRRLRVASRRSSCEEAPSWNGRYLGIPAGWGRR